MNEIELANELLCFWNIINESLNLTEIMNLLAFLDTYGERLEDDLSNKNDVIIKINDKMNMRIKSIEQLLSIYICAFIYAYGESSNN